MIELQLREAFALMKAGKKAEAKSIVQAVLREDKRNSSAWWLLAMLLEDGDEIVHALEHLLTLNPEHLGARKRLAQLRPEYAHLNPQPNSKQKTSDKSEEYWERLDDRSKRRTSRALSETEKSTLYGLVIGLVVFFAIAALGMMQSLGTAAGELPQEGEVYEQILSDLPNTPEGVVQAYIEAYYRQSIEALTALTCPAFHSQIGAIAASFNDPFAGNNVLDFSETTFDLDETNSSDSYAYVDVHGITIIQDGTVTVRNNWDEMAAAGDSESWSQYLILIEGQWYVCPDASEG